MGTIRHRKDGGWFVDYVDATGRRRREIIGPGDENKRLARQILAQREAEATLGKHHVVPRETPRFGGFADDWLRRVRARRPKPKTVEGYEAAVRLRLRPAFGGARLAGITRRDVEEFVTRLAETGTRLGKKKARVPLSPRTINFTLDVLKFILNDAVEQGFLTGSPAARVRPLPERDGADGIQFLRPAEITRLLDVAQEPHRTLYNVAVHTGLRRGELLGLKWGDLDLRKRLLHVRRTRGRVKDGEDYVVVEDEPKTGGSKAAVDLSPSIVQVLLALSAGDDPKEDHVFRSPQTGGALDPDNVDRRFKADLTLAALPDIPFHSLRHTFASLLVAAGAHPKYIQRQMRHRSIKTTLDTYGHLMEEAFAGVGERLDALLRQGKQVNAQTTVMTTASATA